MKTQLTTLLTSAVFSFSLAAAEVKPYTLSTCIVTDNKLGSMGKVIVKEHEGQEVKFCCKPCIKKFDANPAKYLKKIK
jgi:hypothetical protein